MPIFTILWRGRERLKLLAATKQCEGFFCGSFSSELLTLVGAGPWEAGQWLTRCIVGPSPFQQARVLGPSLSESRIGDLRGHLEEKCCLLALGDVFVRRAHGHLQALSLGHP